MYINDISAVSVYSESLKFYKVSVPRRTPPGSFSYFIDYLQSYGSACLGIGQCMMMAGQAVSATSGNSMQLMIGKLLAEFATRSPACTKKQIAGIWQPIMPVYLFQTPFVERAVVCHQRQSLYKRSYFAPNVRKIIGFIGICRRKPMYFGSPQGIIIRIRTYKPVYFIDYRPGQ